MFCLYVNIPLVLQKRNYVIQLRNVLTIACIIVYLQSPLVKNI